LIPINNISRALPDRRSYVEAGSAAVRQGTFGVFSYKALLAARDFVIFYLRSAKQKAFPKTERHIH
jgi:hypothetical protein